MHEHQTYPAVDLDALEHVPNVSFDIDLGKHVDYIDFDYAAYDAHLRAKNAPPEKSSDLNIELMVPGKAMRAMDILGAYNFRTNKMFINAVRKPSSKGINQTLVHETQHFIDFAYGKISDKELKLNSRKNHLMLAGMVITPPAFIAEIGGIIVENNAVTLGAFATLLAGVSMSYAGSYIYLTKQDFEKRAREAEPFAPRVITVVKDS